MTSNGAGRPGRVRALRGAAASDGGRLKLDPGSSSSRHQSLDFSTIGTSRLALPESRSTAMATVIHWFQSNLDRLDRPLAFLVVALFLLALRRTER
jgi:hypothetical protein